MATEEVEVKKPEVVAVAETVTEVEKEVAAAVVVEEAAPIVVVEEKVEQVKVEEVKVVEEVKATKTGKKTKDILAAFKQSIIKAKKVFARKPKAPKAAEPLPAPATTEEAPPAPAPEVPVETK